MVKKSTSPSASHLELWSTAFRGPFRPVPAPEREPLSHHDDDPGGGAVEARERYVRIDVDQVALLDQALVVRMEPLGRALRAIAAAAVVACGNGTVAATSPRAADPCPDITTDVRVVSSGRGGAIVETKDLKREVWPTGHAPWKLALLTDELSAMGSGRVVTASLAVVGATWMVTVRWLELSTGRELQRRRIEGTTPAGSLMTPGLTGLALGHDDRAWLTGRFPGSVRSPSRDRGLYRFTAMGIVPTEAEIVRVARLPGPRSGATHAIPFGKTALFLTSGLCTGSERCVAMLTLEREDEAELWPSKKLDAAIGTTVAAIVSLHVDGGPGGQLLIVREGRLRALTVSGQVHLVGAVASGSLVLLIEVSGPAAVDGETLVSGQYALRLRADDSVEQAVRLPPMGLSLHPFGGRFLAETRSGTKVWPRRCPLSSPGVSPVGHADVDDLFDATASGAP